MEHWLPLFHERLETLIDYCPEAIVTADHQIKEAFDSRWELIADYYDARVKTGAEGRHVGRRRLQAGAADRLYLKPSQWDSLLDGHSVGQFTSFDAPPEAPNAVDLGGRRHEGFAQARTAQGVNLFDRVADHVKAANAAGRRVVIAGFTEGSATRLTHLLQEHGATTPVPVPDYAEVQKPAGRRDRRRGLAARARLRARRAGGDRRGGHPRRPPVAAAAQAPAVGALHRRGRGAERGRPGGASRARRRPLRGPGHARDPVRAPRLPASSPTTAATSCSCRSRTSTC